MYIFDRLSTRSAKASLQSRTMFCCEDNENWRGRPTACFVFCFFSFLKIVLCGFAVALCLFSAHILRLVVDCSGR